MRPNNVLGLIYSSSYEQALNQMTALRTIASVPFGCRYRMIDFPLSNMVNAGMTQVGIITKSNYRSLMDHIGAGRPWDLDRKREGLFLLPPYSVSGLSDHGADNKVAALHSNMHFVNRSQKDYVLLTDANSVYNFDFRDLMEFHEKKKADITIAYKNGIVPNLQGIMKLSVEKDGRVTKIKTAKSENQSPENYSFNIMIMKSSLLEDLINEAHMKERKHFSEDVIAPRADDLKIFGYKIEGYSNMASSLLDYYNMNMDLLQLKNRQQLFNRANPITTKVLDNIPATYGLNADVHNSLIADGCKINGIVENSILFRDVVVEEGVHIKNSILMQGTIVRKNSNLNAVIADKEVIINEDRYLSGDAVFPVYISKKATV
ncbi:MAG: glucose-1-phosphate adenylyltransferase subunit GlgD [Clostridia bacterium]|nr:glucose-1-phosphate adenylyltransferase subunit GlgD [Clostridia bacterium]